MKLDELAHMACIEAENYVDRHTRNGVAVGTVVIRKKPNGKITFYFHGASFNHDAHECGEALRKFFEYGAIGIKQWKEQNNG